MPGVRDAQRKTGLLIDQRNRKQEMEELIRMVKEDRLHEADERQMEALKLSLELNTLLVGKQPTAAVEPDQIAQAVEAAVKNALRALPTASLYGSPTQDPARPTMKHTSLGDLQQADSGLEISGELGEVGQTSDDGASKLEKLKKLKGNG